MGKVNDMNWKKILPVALPIVVFVGLILFLALSGRQKQGRIARYVDGRDVIEIEGVRYALINDTEAQSYIGSLVSDVVKATRGEQYASIRSKGLFAMTLGVLSRIEGDADTLYLLDGNGNLYAREGQAEALRNRLADRSAFSDYKIIGKNKKNGEMREMPAEDYAAITAAAADPEGCLEIREKNITEDYDTRREVFAFTEDGMFFRACSELFLYNNEVFVTVGFVDSKSSKDKKSVLTGKRLPKEIADRYRDLWN